MALKNDTEHAYRLHSELGNRQLAHLVQAHFAVRDPGIISYLIHSPLEGFSLTGVQL